MLVASLVALLSWGPALNAQGAAIGAANDGGAHAGVLGALFSALAMVVAFGRLPSAARSDDALAPAWHRFFAVAGCCGAAALLERLAFGAAFHVITEALLGSACALAALLYVAERLGPRRVSAPVLMGATLAGPAFAACALLLAGGHGSAIDLRLVGWLQALPFVVLPTMVWRLPSTGLRGGDWLVAVLAYGAGQAAAGWSHLVGPWVPAAVVDPASHPVLQSAGLVVALSWLALAFRRQSLARAASTKALPGGSVEAAPEPAAAGITSQRSTSEMTSA